MLLQYTLASTALIAALLPSAAKVTTPTNLRHAARPPAKAVATIFVSDKDASTIYLFRAGNAPKLLGTITSGISRPLGITVDASGTLYVPNSGNHSVTEYPAGSTSPSVTITAGLSLPQFATVDLAGNLWVSDDASSSGGNGYVLEYPPGATTPSQTLTNGILAPEGLATDAKGNLYVANRVAISGVPDVAIFPPGATTPSATFGAGVLSQPLGIALDKRGNIYVADFITSSGGSQIDVFSAKGSHKLLRSIQSNPFYLAAGGVAIDRNDRLYVGSGGLSSEYVLQFAHLGKSSPMVFYQSSDTLFGVAADPSAQP